MLGREQTGNSPGEYKTNILGRSRDGAHFTHGAHSTHTIVKFVSTADGLAPYISGRKCICLNRVFAHVSAIPLRSDESATRCPLTVSTSPSLLMWMAKKALALAGQLGLGGTST